MTPVASTYLFVAGTLLLSLNFVRIAGLAVSDWCYFGALGLALIETSRDEDTGMTFWVRNRFIWPSVLVILGAAISTVNAAYPLLAATELIQQVFVATLFVSLVWLMVMRQKARTVIHAFIGTGVLTVTVAVLDKITGSEIGPRAFGTSQVEVWDRYVGTLEHPNKFGYFLVLTVLLTSVRLLETVDRHGGRGRPLGWAALIALQLYGIYLSGSMTAYIGLAAGIVILALVARKRVTRLAVWSLPVLIACVFVVGVGMLAGEVAISGDGWYENSLVKAGVDRVARYTAKARLEVYSQAVERILSNPLIGEGYDELSTSGLEMYYRSLEDSVHNSFVQVWYVGGFLAFLGWLLIYISLGVMSVRIIAESARERAFLPMLGVALAGIAIIIMDQFQDSIYQREKWLVFALLAGFSWSRGELAANEQSRAMPAGVGLGERKAFD